MVSRDTNALKFALVSFLAQAMIVMLVSTAQASISLQTPSVATNMINEHTGFIDDKVDNINLNDYTADEISTGGSGLENAYDPIAMFLNIGKFLGAFVTIIANFGASWVTLAVITAQSGVYSWFVGFIVLIWQVGTIYYLLKFIFPSRFGSGQ